MKITTYNKLVSLREGGKQNLSIAQIAEVNKINNALTDGEFYRSVKKMHLTDKEFSDLGLRSELNGK